MRTPSSGPASRTPGLLLAVFLAVILCTCAFPGAVRDLPELSARRWPQAEEQFRQDRFWLGGDGASSVDLGQGRVLWLFGDSFIGDGASRDRHAASLVRNTIAIQQGTDPSSTPARFYWKTTGPEPQAFFPSPGRTWYWPGSGMLVEGKLLLFLMEIASSDGGLGFEARGWGAVLVSNPSEDPGSWRITSLEVPDNPFHVVVGSACCLSSGNHLYAFGADSEGHGAYLVRWKLADAAKGDLKKPEWWAGDGGWVEQVRLAAKPAPLFREAQMEFTVHYEPVAGRFIQIQTDSFLSRCLVYRSSRSLTGPWSGKKQLFCPEVPGGRSILVYAGKAHPGLKGADIICTMAMNSLDPEIILGDNSLYYPVFVRCDFGAEKK